MKIAFCSLLRERRSGWGSFRNTHRLTHTHAHTHTHSHTHTRTHTNRRLFSSSVCEVHYVDVHGTDVCEHDADVPNVFAVSVYTNKDCSLQFVVLPSSGFHYAVASLSHSPLCRLLSVI